ncbi:restriction endonuclease subunit S, partial [Mesomycoplasma hyorhinis]|uniref:restriction endonuclease subunit S n=1 Tax=Mesomycoplasma hyorhinis TaxID=2100 RepID=UPI001C05AB0F
GILTLNFPSKYNLKFLFLALIFLDLTKLQIGGTVPHFTASMMEKLEITILNNVQEQTKIAEVFSSLNLTYAQLKRKLNLIKNIQKSVLNKMFV